MQVLVYMGVNDVFALLCICVSIVIMFGTVTIIHLVIMYFSDDGK